MCCRTFQSTTVQTTCWTMDYGFKHQTWRRFSRKYVMMQEDGNSKNSGRSKVSSVTRQGVEGGLMCFRESVKCLSNP